MIKLISLNNPRMGQAFIDYMSSRQVTLQMTLDEQGSYVLWLPEDEHLIEVEAELKQFLQQPNHPKYREASWSLNTKSRASFHYSSPSLMSLIKSKAGWFTLGIIVIGVAIYLLQIVGFGRVIFDALHFPASSVQQWQLWRWISHALLHFSVIHIVFNMLWWWQLGGDIEKKLGSSKLIGLFLLSSACSGLAQYWVEGANFGGLSGVVYALVGYLWIIGWKKPQLGLGMQKPILVFMLVWLVLGFVQPFMAIANSAHLAGLVVGILYALVDVRRYA
ncbi:rhomboid family intramembrane serine protease GlpG [Vibrio viridaestus]|uniref:Rhomboid family intramembrane serine protease GlpG n=1 Tax=Vibrio viridaestus TaxID=2487322 RepID=A0A3N9TCU9_9VIBR|nr:rhomboid family intramembrane serine protease GlpG [Vibrio viridaestus]RQW61513.1 rhomboid family intramembrane serine protease GlpG [Vibrio viridaestus]